MLGFLFKLITAKLERSLRETWGSLLEGWGRLSQCKDELVQACSAQQSDTYTLLVCDQHVGCLLVTEPSAPHFAGTPFSLWREFHSSLFPFAGSMSLSLSLTWPLLVLFVFPSVMSKGHGERSLGRFVCHAPKMFFPFSRISRFVHSSY